MKMTVRPCITTAVTQPSASLPESARRHSARRRDFLRRRPSCRPEVSAGPPRSRLPHPRAAGRGGRPADRRRHPGRRPGLPMTKGENGVWEVTLGPSTPAPTATTSTSTASPTIDPRNPRDQRVEQQRLERGPRPGLRLHGHEGRAARRGRRGHLLLDGAARRSAACTSTRRRATRRASDKYPVFYLLHGAGDSDDSWTLASAAPASSSTT